MARAAPKLAKLTRPRLHGLVARDRLLALLDKKREHPAVWIAGPPGAGKTTFYRELMRCYAGLDNRAEALSVYRWLRQQLSVVLGMQPSASSETLARGLRLQ